MLALVTKEPFKNLYRTDDNKFITALVVVINRSEDGIVYARIITSASVRLYDDEERLEDEQGGVGEIMDHYLDALSNSDQTNLTEFSKALSENYNALGDISGN